MKKIFYLLFFISVFNLAQKPVDNAFNNSDNRFSQGENERGAKSEKPVDGDIHTAPGNPGDPVPIDSHIPLLLLSGIIIAAVLTVKQRKTYN